MTMIFTIREHISSLIRGMKKADGYHFDWGDVNVYGTEENYPCAKVMYKEDENLDRTSQRGSGRNQYHNAILFEIKAEFKHDTMDEVNAVEMTTMLDEDLKRLFGINHSFPTIHGGYARYDGHRPVFSKNDNIPCGVDWKLQVTYYQRRDNPSVYT